LRTYDSPLRSAQAADTRARILTAAGVRFAAAGYAGTSLAEIAAEAGVSVETVKLNGPKRALLIAAFDQAFTGAEGVGPVHERPLGQRLMEEPDTEALLHGYIDFVSSANERASVLWLTFQTAAMSDPVILESLNDVQQRRSADFARSIELFRARGMTQSARPDDELAAALSFLVSPSSYLELVVGSGWSFEQYTGWLADAIRRLILAP
jgi:AcrR family transcriptional regulator